MAPSKSAPRIAVIGSGAAATAALCGLVDSHQDFEVTIFDGSFRSPMGSIVEIKGPGARKRFYDGIYRHLRQLPRAFPPPKTQFGRSLPRHRGQPRLYDNKVIGGLTNYWGGTLLPFRKRELAAWPPLSRALDVAYGRIAEIVGISGADDGLSGYYGDALVNRPPVPVLPAMRALARSSTRTVAFGINRCAVETRPRHPNACVGCGECLAGCFKESIYSTPRTLDVLDRDPRLRVWMSSFAQRVDLARRDVEYFGSGSFHRTRFDVILLAAGCLETTTIILRSLGISEAVEIRDNATLTFPMFAPRSLVARTDDADPTEHVGLANVLGVVHPEANQAPIAQLQIYPTSAYMLRYSLDRWWPWLRRLHEAVRRRLYWVRMFVHSDDSQTYRLQLSGITRKIGPGRRAPLGSHVDALVETARQALREAGFVVPPVPPVVQQVNSHYGATLPFGNSLVPVENDARIAPGIYLCDATCFPEMPAVHPSLTIMAHAYRTARLAIGLPF